MSLEGVVFDWVGICTSKWAPCGAVAVGWWVGGGAVRVTAGLDGRGMGGDRVVGGQGALLTVCWGVYQSGLRHRPYSVCRVHDLDVLPCDSGLGTW